jgi:hypothetical protein
MPANMELADIATGARILWQDENQMTLVQGSLARPELDGSTLL